MNSIYIIAIHYKVVPPHERIYMKQKTIVYVVNKKGKPLMPTTRCGYVYRLMKSGKAVPINNNPFTIRLKYETPDVVQNLYYGNDSGRENIGVGVSDKDGNGVFFAELQTHNKSIKKSMTTRAEFRRNRRRYDRQSKQRKAKHDGTTIKNGNDDTARSKHTCKSVKITYPGANHPVTHKIIKGKESKFNNRRRKEDWVTPSARQLIQMHMNMLKQTMKILPISHVSLERVAFDFQKLENQNIRKWEYGKGPLYGYDSYQDYINEEQHGKCLCCEKNKIEYYHHIIPRSKGGSDKMSNIAGLCWDCHYGPMGVHQCQETQNRLSELKNEFNKQYKISLLNSAMPFLIREMRLFCKNHGIEFYITDGRKTAETRETLGIDKMHSVDGYCISLAKRNDCNPKFVPDRIHELRRFKKKSNCNILALNKREYYIGKKLIAVNRHKSTVQKEDSLEEFLILYRKTHTEKEVQQFMHQIIIKPAKRTYTFHKEGIVCRFHAGDTIIYEKKNKIKGNIKRMIFVCTGIDVSNQKLAYNTKKKSMKYCKVIKAGCIPFVGFRKLTLTKK